MSIKVVVADDHEIMREGLCALLEKEADIAVCGRAEDGRMAVELCVETRPNVLVIDITMPHLNGIEATRQLLRLQPDLKVIALSMHVDRMFISEMMKAGACAYLPKRAAYIELVLAIREVMDGKQYLSPMITGVVVEDYLRSLHHKAESPVDTLAPREREVLQLIAEGQTTKEIATALHISVKTVEWHRHNLMEHLHIDNVAGLTKFAIREGFTSTAE